MGQRHADLDMAKGLAILLVVFGHLVARQDPGGVGWYEPLRHAVYGFHMPFFLYLSGLVAWRSGLLLRGRRAFGAALRSRARRLLLPFFGLGGLVVLGKLAAARVMAVDNPPSGLLAGLSTLLWHTADSPALTVWYLLVLFCVSLASLWLLDGRAARLPWLLAGSLLLYPLPLPPYLYADRIGTYALFFLAGAAAGQAGAGWEGWMDRHWRPCLGLLLAGLVALALSPGDLAQKPPMLVLGLLCMPALHGLLRSLRLAWMQAILLYLGRYCFMIYLGNTICIGLAKGVMLHFVSWDGAHFAPFAAALMSAGLLGPIALKRLALKRLPVLDRITD